MTFTVPDSKFKFGEDAVLKVEMTNKARKHHLVKGTISAQAVDYTGRVGSQAPRSWCEVCVCNGCSGSERRGGQEEGRDKGRQGERDSYHDNKW